MAKEAQAMPRDILQIMHESGNVYHFKNRVWLYGADGDTEWNSGWASDLLRRVVSPKIHAVGDGGSWVCKPFECVRYVNQAEREEAEARQATRATKGVQALLK